MKSDDRGSSGFGGGGRNQGCSQIVAPLLRSITAFLVACIMP